MSVLLLLLPLITSQADDFSRHLYPVKTNLVARVDLRAVRQSGLMDEEMKEGFENMLKSNEQISRLSKILEFDPAKQVHGFTVCGGGDGRGRRDGDRNTLVIVNGEFPEAKLATALKDMAEKGELTALEHNDLPIYFNHRLRQAIYFSLIDSRTAIISSSKELIEDAIQGLTDLREPTKELNERLTWEDADKKAAVVLAGVFPEAARQQLARVPQLSDIADKMIGYNFSFRIDSDPRFQGRFTMTDANAAKQALTTFQALLTLGKAAMNASGQRPDILEMLNAMQLSDKGADLILNVQITRSLLETISSNNRKDGERMRERARQRREERAKEIEERAKKREQNVAEPDAKQT